MAFSAGDGPFHYAVPVTPLANAYDNIYNANCFFRPTAGIYVGYAGNLNVRMATANSNTQAVVEGGLGLSPKAKETVMFYVPAGTTLKIRVDQVHACNVAGANAAGIIALF